MPAVESLEGRALMAGSPPYSPPAMVPPPDPPAMIPAAVSPPASHPGNAPRHLLGSGENHASSQRRASGIVTKVPHFYEFYTGPK